MAEKTYTVRFALRHLDKFEVEAVGCLIGSLKGTALERKCEVLADPHESPEMQTALLRAYDEEAARADRILAALSVEEEAARPGVCTICGCDIPSSRGPDTEGRYLCESTACTPY